MLTPQKIEFIEFMMSADVLRFGDFTTKSGRQTPYFVNTGNYKTGMQISKLGHFYAECINQSCGDDFDAMFGPAYKGIALAVSAASALAVDFGIDKPYFFNRKEAKDHGEGGSLIGYAPKQGDNVIIIEDVITAGTALREVLPILHGIGATVKDMFISVNRCEIGQNPNMTVVQEVKSEFGINVHSIIDVTDIYAYLSEKTEYAEVLPRMKAYMDQYCVIDPS